LEKKKKRLHFVLLFQLEILLI